jgi:DnaJ-like protein
VTERKPPRLRPENWIERQIREATERGAFDNLPGAGKPIPDLDRPFTAERWALDWVQREGGDPASMLPPLLALRKERAQLLASLAEVPNESMLRETVLDFNRRLLDQYRRPNPGPLVAVGVLDLEETLADWRSRRPQPVPKPPQPRSRRRRWWRRSGSD